MTLAFGAVMALAVALAPKQVKNPFLRRFWMDPRHAVASDGPLVEPDFGDGTRADAQLSRKGRTPVSGGLLTLPPSFQSADGFFDLVIHFHGNTDLVEDSYGVAGINAAVILVNLGIGSGPYEDRFSNPDLFREMLSRAETALEKRGLKNPRLRRVGLSSWSAGYGAIVRIIENPTLADRIDSIILLDGIHASFLNGTEIDPGRIAPFERFARKAVAGEKLFFISHSDIKPVDYAGCRETTDAILKAVGVSRMEGGTSPQMPALSSTHGVPKSKVLALTPRTEAHAGKLHVRGFTGETPEHHMAHLIQMATLALPELAAHWAAPASR